MRDIGSDAGILSGYRVLDLAEDVGFACGTIFAELGADVIKVEKPEGNSTRHRGPFYHDIAHPEKSLFWFAYNLNKRGITLAIESPDGRDIFKKLVKNADIVIESFPPGYMDDLGLGYPALSAANPRIIMTSLTPFGQYGPYKDCKASDIVLQAEGGSLYLTGDEDRAPLQQYPPQASFQASLAAAMATMVALYHREITGEGQWIDAAALDPVIFTTIFELAFWQFGGEVVRRTGQKRRRGAQYAKIIWRCQDVNIIFLLTTGGFGPRLKSLVEWMDSEGKAGELASVKDWAKLDLGKMNAEELKVWEDTLAAFFLEHNGEEIVEFAQKAGIFAVVAQSPRDIAADPHLKARNFWQQVEHDDLSATLAYPGPFCRLGETPIKITRRPPMIGEHNEEVYKTELGLSSEDLALLKGNGVI